MEIFTFRLRPGQDLDNSIAEYVRQHGIQAGCVLSGVGSLTQATLRLANRSAYSTYNGHFEIVSITGTVSVHGSHLHISISDGDGRTVGGHLVPGCTVYTTAEMVITAFPELVYRREMCAESGYEELVIYPREG